MVHQELQPIPERSVAENIFVGRYPMRSILVDHEKMYEKAAQVLKEVHLNYDPRAKLKTLSVSQMQLVEIAKMLKAIHAQESKKASREKAAAVVTELKAMKLPEASKKVEAGIEETLTYCDFPTEHWTKIRTNNAIERLNREIRRRTRVVGAFPDGNSALMLVCARLRHVVGTQWGSKKYMNMKHLEAMETETTAV